MCFCQTTIYYCCRCIQLYGSLFIAIEHSTVWKHHDLFILADSEGFTYPGCPSPKWGSGEVYLYRSYSGIAIGCPPFAQLLLFVEEKSCHDGGCRHMGHTVWFLQSRRDPGCSALLSLLSRASSASVTLQSPGRGKSCLRGLALEETVVVMKPQWWTRISCMLELGKSFTSIQRPSWQQDCS